MGGLEEPAPLPASAPPRFGEYEVIEEIARGGMGVVYKARQRGLDRIVAVKTILAGQFAGPQQVVRFRSEARAAAALHHPSIVAIHDVGEQDGFPFFSMDYVEGRTLTEMVADGPLPCARAARYVQIIADAVHYAHERGILHRDLKPSNVIIDSEDRPRITDFGLAKHLSDPQLSPQEHPQLTHTGQALGSPSFMPPEQVSAKRVPLTPATDVYALGALLYHCLTARAPFLGETIAATLHQVVESDPVSPRLLNPGVPRDLETMCLKCLAKEPERRYATARALADDLGRFLRDEPICARPVGRAEKFRRWCRRHPALASVSTLAALLVIAVVTISSTAAIRLENANKEGREKLRQSYLAQARANRWSGRPGRRFGSLDVIQKATAIRPSIQLRNEAIALLALPDIRPIKSIQKGSNALAFSRDLASYFQQDSDGRFHFRRTADEGTYFSWQPPPGTWTVSRNAWTLDGRYCAIALVRQPAVHLEVLDLERQRSVFSRSNFVVRKIDFSEDGTRMALVGHTINQEQEVRLELFDWPAGRVLRTETPAIPPSTVRFDPTGRFLAIASTESRRIRIVEAQTGELVRELRADKNASGIDWSRDGQQLAVACRDGNAYIWKIGAAPAPPIKLPHGDVVTTVSFDPTGEWMVSGGWDEQLRLWSVITGQQAHHEPVWESAVFSTRDRMISYSPKPMEQAIGEFHAADEYRRFPSCADPIVGRVPSFSPDGRILAAPDLDSTRLWDVATGAELGRLPGVKPEAALFSPAGDWLAIRSDSRLDVWQMERAQGSPGGVFRLTPLHKIRMQGSSGPLATDGAGRRVAVIDNLMVKVIDVATGESLFDRHRLAITSEAWYAVTLDHDGRWCMASTWSGSQTFTWDIESTSPGRVLPFPKTSGFASQADGRVLVTGSIYGYSGWDAGGFAPRWSFARPSSGNSHPRLALATRARLGAATFSKSSVRLFDPDDGRELATVEAPEDATIYGLALAPDGDRLAVYSVNGLAVWDLRSVRRQLAGLGLDWDAPPTPPAPSVNRPLSIVVTAPEAEPGPAKGEPDFAPRDPACTSRLIDLSAHYNAALTSSWFNASWEENNLASVPRGLHTLDGIPFDLRGIVQLAGTELDMSERFPAEVAGIRVGLKSPALHFLHATGWEPPDGTPVGEYVLRYADGMELRVPLVNAQNIRVWSRNPHHSVSLHPGSTVAWRGDSPASRANGWSIVLYRFRLENPRPDVVITSLDFVSAMNKAAPFLIAITAE